MNNGGSRVTVRERLLFGRSSQTSHFTYQKFNEMLHCCHVQYLSEGKCMKFSFQIATIANSESGANENFRDGSCSVICVSGFYK